MLLAIALSKTCMQVQAWNVVKSASSAATSNRWHCSSICWHLQANARTMPEATYLAEPLHAALA